MVPIATSALSFFAREDSLANLRLLVVRAVHNSYRQTLGDKLQVIGWVVAGLESVHDTQGGRDSVPSRKLRLLYTSCGTSPPLDQGKPCPCKIGVRALFGNQQHQSAAAQAVHHALSANRVL